MKPTDAAIVGIGALFPRASGPAEFWRSVEDGVDAIADVPPERWDPGVYYTPTGEEHGADRFYCRRGGFIDDLASFDPIRFGVMPNVVDATEPDQLLALRVTAEAIADAGGEDRLPGDRSRIGVVFGRGGYMGVATARLDQRVRTAHQLAATLRDVAPELGEEKIAAIRAAFQDGLGADRPEAAIGLVPSFTAARIANRLDFGGPAYTVDAACATSLLAVEQAAAELAAGRCDVMVAGAVHHTHIATLWSVFTQLRALSPSQRIRPFDRRADGTLISEGTGVVLLKRLADAERDGDRIYAVVRGTGTASDGRASSLMSPLVDGQVRALERAWRAAGLDPTAPGALGLLEAHGTGTPVGDDAELATLARVFGPRTSTAAAIGLGTVKSNIGHAMQASGIAGLIKAALAVHHRVLPPTLHVDDPHKGFAATRMRPLLDAEPWESTGTPRRAGVNAFGFGGINAHAVLEEPPGTFTPAVRVTEPPRVLLIAGQTPAEVAERLADTHRSRTPGDGPCRLAILDPTPRRLELAAKVVARAKPWRGRSDVWFTPKPLGGRTAFLFPGLALEGTGELLGQAVDDIGSGRSLTAALERIGIRPDLLAGHSLGEWTAMVVAGMYPREAIDAFLDSLRPGTLDVPDLVYAAVGCGAAQAAAVAGHVVVSHDNCPHQSVICGPAADVAEALRRLAAEGVLGQELPFRSGFHTPMWEPYLDQVRATFARLPLRPPAVPVWSATTGEPYPAAEEDVRALVIRHLLEPVRFRALTERLYAEGVRTFVQVGPGGLPGFVDDTLRDHDHLTVAADDAAGLPRVAAALWTEGASPRWEAMNVRVPQREVRLALGSPIISLNGRTPQAAAPRQPVRRDHPVLASLDAALDDMSAAVRTVVDAWQEPVAPERAESRTRREFSLATMPYVLDHCVYLQPDDWPDDSDRFPVVPMTTLLEVMAGAALELVPGKVVAGFAGVRAMRWLPVAPATTADIIATRRAPDTVRVTVTGFASADVLLCDSYPVPPEPRHTALAGAESPPVSAAGLYDDRWMFHGPGFAGVRDVREISEEGIGGELEALPAPGALLDAAGQLYGHWMQVRLPTDRLVFPVSIDRVQLYGPHPRPGARLVHSARIRSVKADIVRGDIELSAPNGRLWARIEGWAYRRFAADERVWPMKFTPETHAIGEPQPDGTTVVKRRWTDAASRELVMRRYLGAAERTEYEALTPRAQQSWLLGRMAIKDAVRHARWARGDGPVFPAEIRVADDLSVAGARVRLERSDDDLAVARCDLDDPNGLEAL
ncbi:polyketide synthase dehydratase domain-containing protein [Actinomadura barringtoniae]|uniref:Polyketide synthase dehydratase domain-containing protein n=1 Tax=Actinomadura barringtoniae TaxID=1427535 RepID=A0A939TDP2_9ACTN|nr:beta-ketoacyl synthase N-terminal-like domain-containing protein [Actinomadura barringtoniae]MBO2455812.1 polyketide synthase dehydratase domain-containing protein [Actinomadura barringtoniae]